MDGDEDDTEQLLPSSRGTPLADEVTILVSNPLAAQTAGVALELGELSRAGGVAPEQQQTSFSSHQPAAEPPLHPAEEGEERRDAMPRPEAAVYRRVLDEEEFAQQHPEAAESVLPLPADCVRPSMRHSAGTILPILHWLPTYTRASLLADGIVGATIGVMLIPQGLAYAIVGRLPPIYGLYTSVTPSLVYVLLGQSRELSIGAFALTSLMSAKAVARIVPEPEQNPTDAVLAALAVAFAVGLMQIAMSLCRLGFLAVFLAPPLVSGFTTAAAFAIAASQLKALLGMSIPAYPDEEAGLIRTYAYAIGHLGNASPAAIIASLLTFVVLILCRILSLGGRLQRDAGAWTGLRLVYGRAWPVPIPGELVAVVLGTAIAATAGLHDKYGLAIVGIIPSGFPAPSLPTHSLSAILTGALGDVFTLAVVAYAISISVARTYAAKSQTHISANQELFALGVCNLLGAFFSCHVAGPSLSRSSLISTMGVQTQLHGFFSAVIIIVVLVALTHLFEHLPTAVLAAIILMALRGLLQQMGHAWRYWRVKKDFIIWMSAFLSTWIFGIAYGLALGVGISLITVLYGTTRPYCTLLGQVSGTELYRDVRHCADAAVPPGLRIFRFHARLYFANAEYFESMLRKYVAMPLGLSEIDLTQPHSLGVIILDASTINEIDSAGVTVLQRLVKDYSALHVEFLIASCRANVRETLYRVGFFDTFRRDHMFVSVHDAVLAVTARLHTARIGLAGPVSNADSRLGPLDES